MSLPTAAEWAATEPFPHFILDRAFDPVQVRRAPREFPSPADPCWRTFASEHEVGKQECSDETRFGPATRALLGAMGSLTPALSKMTGLELIPALIGGGMHQSPAGARLGMHVDFNLHPENPGLERKLNMLLFLNQEWPPDGGGELELGGTDKKMSPQANRLIVFETSDRSYHGHPNPVRKGLIRRSLAMYFYAPVGEQTPTPHSTVWA